MRWLRFLALIIFVFLTAYAIPITVKNFILSNVIVTFILIVITIWVAIGFFKTKK